MLKNRLHQPLASINVVPYIDVMLVLLVIFMVTMPLLTQSVHVTLPQTQGTPIDTHHVLPIMVTVDKKGRYFLNDSEHPQQAISLTQLMINVAAHHRLAPQRPVLVQGDQSVKYATIVQLMAYLQQAGVTEVGMLTTPSQNN